MPINAGYILFQGLLQGGDIGTGHTAMAVSGEQIVHADLEETTIRSS